MYYFRSWASPHVQSCWASSEASCTSSLNWSLPPAVPPTPSGLSCCRCSIQGVPTSSGHSKSTQLKFTFLSFYRLHSVRFHDNWEIFTWNGKRAKRVFLAQNLFDHPVVTYNSLFWAHFTWFSGMHSAVFHGKMGKNFSWNWKTRFARFSCKWGFSPKLVWSPCSTAAERRRRRFHLVSGLRWPTEINVFSWFPCID